MIIYNGKKMAVCINKGTGANGFPIIVPTEEEMAEILVTATSRDDGKIIKYIGVTTENYEQDAYYLLRV